MELTTDTRVNEVFDNYPEAVKKEMLYLRKLILKAASNVEGLEQLEENLKWGEPSYVTKYGSTLRIDWKAKAPGQYAMNFKCTSKRDTSKKYNYDDIIKLYKEVRSINKTSNIIGCSRVTVKKAIRKLLLDL